MQRVKIKRWQWDEISDILACHEEETVDEIMVQHFDLDIEEKPQFANAPILYIYFGLRKDADAWLKEHPQVKKKDLVLAKDGLMLEGLRKRPYPIYNREWLRLNRFHDITKDAREAIHRLEWHCGGVIDPFTEE